MSKDEDNDDFDPTVDSEIVSTGAAADSSDTDTQLKALPRILRYVLLTDKDGTFVQQRLVAEINELCPHLPLNAAWAEVPDIGTASALAIDLDQLAVAQDRPELRSLADSVRLLSLRLPHISNHLDDHRRVAKSLLLALRSLSPDTDQNLFASLEKFCFGWAALPACSDLLPRHLRVSSAAGNAALLGKGMATHQIALAKQEVWEAVEEEAKLRKARKEAAADDAPATSNPRDNHLSEELISNHHVVARIDEAQLQNSKLKDIIRPLKHVINTPLPLVPVPPLHRVRQQLLHEFPYAETAIDFVLADLIGRTTVTLRPLILCGRSAGGKSRFARRVGQILGLHVWRTDASRSDGATFGGTDRRWYSAEPCHPFLAIAQGKTANPLIVIDELEKAGTRSDYGRLWDCMLGFLEIETSKRYPDPALQAELDLSHVSYIGTVNSLEPLPSAIRDRFRVFAFPNPTIRHLDALLPAITVDLASERGLDSRWFEPLTSFERDFVAANWPGGSIRRLRRAVEAVLHARERAVVRN